MPGTMLVLGIIIGVVIALWVVRGARRRAVDSVFPIAIGVAVVIGLLALLTGHGLASVGAAALLAVGEAIGLIGSAVLGGRAYNALDQHR